ncbi:MAG: HEAT repeat domain-containing protein [Elusimicrobia bacterium]|jgi:hypothetical protein|nr:HEAT repeat domain-containing protein [Elusimicrobiota bacterium]
MKKIVKKTVFIFLVFFAVLAGIRFNAYGQEEINTDVLMGQSIQKYLEGDIPGTIETLDKILTAEPEHERARGLLLKAADRLTENVKSSGDYDKGLNYLKIAGKHLPDSESIADNIKKIELLKSPPEKKEGVKKIPQKTRKEPAPRPVQKTAQELQAEEIARYKSRINNLNAYIRNLKSSSGNSNSSAATEELNKKLDNLIAERKDLVNRIDDIDRVGILPVVGGIIFIGVLLIGFSALIALFKTGNSRIKKNIEDERRTVENLKNTYNKDTEKLSQNLVEYGKSYKRAEELEKNFKKVFNIMEKLTEGGSNEKVVLDDATTGRKAVTGVDPRVRARADSVEVIADIFKDSPQAAEMLKPFLDDKDNRTRGNAAVSYYRYDPEKAVTVLHDMAESDDKWMRLSAAWALGEVGDSDTTFVLEKLLDDKDLQVKETARKSLSRIIGAQAAEVKFKESREEEKN